VTGHSNAARIDGNSRRNEAQDVTSFFKSRRQLKQNRPKSFAQAGNDFTKVSRCRAQSFSFDVCDLWALWSANRVDLSECPPILSFGAGIRWKV